MTRDDDFIGQLEGYLDEFEGATPLPDAIRNAVRAQLTTTKQRGPFSGPMRYRTMNTPLRLALAGAAVAAIAFLAFQFLPRDNFGVEPSPSPSATVNPTPESTPVGFSSFLGAVRHDLPSGRVVLDGAFPLTISFDVPAGTWQADWETVGRATVHKAAGATSPIWVDFFMVDNAYTDPCHPSAAMSPPLGPTVADFVAAVTGWSDFQTSNQAEATLGGKSATHLILTNTIDVTKCDGNPWLQQWTHAGGGDDGGNFGTPGSSREEIWAVDADGTRLIVLVSTFGDETAKDLIDAQHIIDSIQFE